MIKLPQFDSKKFLRRAGWALRWSLVPASVWFLIEILRDPCWTYLDGNLHVTGLTAMAFGWWFFFLLINNVGRLLWMVVTMVLWFPMGVVDGVSAVPIRAARALRAMQLSLDDYRSHHPDEGYPATISAMVPSDFPFRYYQLKYNPIHSRDNGPAARFVLTVVPLRPHCIRQSFTVSEDAAVRYAEGREATPADPAL